MKNFQSTKEAEIERAILSIERKLGNMAGYLRKELASLGRNASLASCACERATELLQKATGLERTLRGLDRFVTDQEY